ncbi:unnamed protein product [Cylicostephanus goldi]|uniref:Uncharacterized protein n=1 Tax=Cylicostephanus goldi TaxID=71465 RepID=A0A3P6SET1_CYLGO|nr:unnamed protein product [Cylicostephanus goldi]
MKDRLGILNAENQELRHKLENLQSVVDEVTSLRKDEEQWREKCSFLENENSEVRKEEKELLKEIEEKKTELTKLKAQNESLTSEVDRLRAQANDFEKMRMRNHDLEQLQSENERLLVEHKVQIAELRSCVASYEQTIKSLRDSEQEMKKRIDEKLAEAEKLDDECRTLRNVGDKLSEESVFATLLNNELKLKLAQAYNEIDELKATIDKERDARKAEVQSICSVAEINKKVR